MSKAERNILKFLAIMAIIPELMRENNPSKTVEKILTRIDRNFKQTRTLYPELITGSKDCNRIEKEVYRLQSQKTIHICCLTSICLAGFSDAIDKMRGKRKASVVLCMAAVKSLHGYFDRKLSLFDEYDKAVQFLEG